MGRHTSRFLLVWLMGLPLIIWQVYSWATPVIIAIVAYFLLGVEAIGLRIEQPFDILPIPKTLNKCRLDVKEMLDAREGTESFVFARWVDNDRSSSPYLPTSADGRARQELDLAGCVLCCA